MGEKRIVGPSKTRGYPYPICKKNSVDMDEAQTGLPHLDPCCLQIQLFSFLKLLTTLHSERPKLHRFGHSECNRVTC